MLSVLDCLIVVKHTEFYLGQLRFNATSNGNVECFKKSIVPNVTVWRVLRKCLHLRAYKLSIVQVVEMDSL
jgi:hypothetical protein